MPEETTTVARRKPEPFTVFLAELQDGAFNAELTERLSDLTAQMQRLADATGGKQKGKLTISIDLQLDRGVYDVSADAAVKLPKEIRGRSIMYGQPGGGLSRRNPRQTEMDFAGPTRDVSTDAAANVRVVR